MQANPGIGRRGLVWNLTTKTTIEYKIGEEWCPPIYRKLESASVTEARHQLDIRSLEDRRKNNWLSLCLLTKVLHNEDQHNALSEAYVEITGDREIHWWQLERLPEENPTLYQQTKDHHKFKKQVYKIYGALNWREK